MASSSHRVAAAVSFRVQRVSQPDKATTDVSQGGVKAKGIKKGYSNLCCAR